MVEPPWMFPAIQFGGLGRAIPTPSMSSRDDHELVAPSRAGIALADAAFQTLGNLDQQPVTDFVAVRIVEELEMIEIDEQQGAVALAATLPTSA